MLKYRVKADRDLIVEGLGVFTPDEEREFTEGDERQFFSMRGLHLNQGNMPPGATLTVVVVDELDEADAKYVLEGDEN